MTPVFQSARSLGDRTRGPRSVAQAPSRASGPTCRMQSPCTLRLFIRPSLLVASALLGNVACAGQPSLYVIRPSSVSMSAMNAEVSVEGLAVVTLGPNECVGLEPGARTRQVRYRWRAGPLGNPKLETEYASVQVTLAPGRVTYLRLVSHTESADNARGGFDATTTWQMERVTEREGKSYLLRCKGQALKQEAHP